MSTTDQKTFWNSYAKKYDRFIERFTKATYAQSFELMKSELKPTDRVLEIGTGTGLVSFAMSPLVAEIIATDYAEETINIAKEKQKQGNFTNITFKVSNADALDFPDESFDVIIASNVFHLIPNAYTVLTHMKRLLKKNGKIIMPTFCHGQSFKTRIISRIMGLSGFEAINKWSLKGFRKFIDTAGLTIEKEIIIANKIPLSFIVAAKK